MADVKLDDIVSLAKRRGFIYQGSDVYGGLSGKNLLTQEYAASKARQAK